MDVRLHVNVDHVATLRQARGTAYPDPVRAAEECLLAGAHGITVHLREDRRHIQDRDVEAIRERVGTLLNLEMAATDEMRDIALRIRPSIVTLVPERREERTTEGGLDVVGNRAGLEPLVESLRAADVAVNLFIDPATAQIEASSSLSVDGVELHTGDYCDSDDPSELERLVNAARLAAQTADLTVAAGHGLTERNLVPLVTRCPTVTELNIGHALVSDALFFGLPECVKRYLAAIQRAVAARAA